MLLTGNCSTTLLGFVFPAGDAVPVPRAAAFDENDRMQLYGDSARVSQFDESFHSTMPTISRADLKKLRKRRARLKKKKMPCQFCPAGNVPRPVYVDYKDLKTLRGLIDREGRILPRRRTGTSALYQRAVRRAVLQARFIGLLPYVSED